MDEMHEFDNVKSDEHPVWSILVKSKYTGDGIKRMEELYDFMLVLKNAVGELTTETLLKFWSEYSDETFWILDALVPKKN